jgi:putative flippase GtrA
VVATDPQASPQAKPGRGLFSQLFRFGVIGGFCALLDFGTYTLERAVFGMDVSPWVDIARAISFVVGTTTAYFLNRKFTFEAGHRKGAGQVGGFVLLYTVTFFVAVGVNQLMLTVLPEFSAKPSVAWVISQATATCINFVMLKWVVFREPRDEGAAQTA